MEHGERLARIEERLTALDSKVQAHMNAMDWVYKRLSAETKQTSLSVQEFKRDRWWLVMLGGIAVTLLAAWIGTK